jgi:hypothetical protein
MAGSWATSAANATRRRSPPESVRTSRASNPARPKHASAALARSKSAVDSHSNGRGTGADRRARSPAPSPESDRRCPAAEPGRRAHPAAIRGERGAVVRDRSVAGARNRERRDERASLPAPFGRGLWRFPARSRGRDRASGRYYRRERPRTSAVRGRSCASSAPRGCTGTPAPDERRDHADRKLKGPRIVRTCRRQQAVPPASAAAGRSTADRCRPRRARAGRSS